MGITTRVKSEMSEKKPFNFALFWDKYGTFFILAIIVAIFGTMSSQYFLTANNITQIFVQSSVTVLIGMGEFFAILIAGIDLSVGAILALSGMVTAKLMLAGVDPFLAAVIGGVVVGGLLGAINGCLVNWTGLHPFIITLGPTPFSVGSRSLSLMPTRFMASPLISLTSSPRALSASRCRYSSLWPWRSFSGF
jgi:D-allose transport system permease protein